MKKQFIEKYKNNLLNIYSHNQLKNCPYEYIIVLKDNIEDEVIDNILYTNYDSFFRNDYLQLPIKKTRKQKKLLTYQEGMKLLDQVSYGTLSITHEIPYTIGLSHFIYDNHLYFHSGYKGCKLNGLNKIACYCVIKDLGINEQAFTQNFESVLIYGTLREVTTNKKTLLEALMHKLTPSCYKELNQEILDHTLILELVIEHMDVKRHFH